MTAEEAPSQPMLSPLVLGALVVGQLGLHASMAGLRMAAPLQALRQGAGAWTVGLLLALFAAAPVLLALHSGRLADRLGYHRPVRLAAGLAIAGMALSVLSAIAPGPWMLPLLCIGASLSGVAANMGMLTIQRTAGLAARDETERMRVFSWLGIAPAFSNVVGPVLAGFVIDASGFVLAYLALMALPVATLATASRVPVLRPPTAVRRSDAAAWTLLALPGMKRLLAINWLLSNGWDVHAFVVPVLGHERGYSASTIGLVLGTFTLSVTAVRMLMPLVAHRIERVSLLRSAMLGSALVFGLYPLAPTALAMAACAALLGLTMGVAQPLIMTTLHQLTPDGRHGQALAFRSMVINASSTLMPLAFGALGAATGAALLFWAVGGLIGIGSWLTRGLSPGRLEADRGPG